MTMRVPRHDKFQLPGLGLLKGLSVTLTHFFKSYRRQRNWRVPGEEPFPGGRFGIFTHQYPEERAPIPDRYRGLPILLYDDATRAEFCTACMACVRACPVGIIHIEQATNAEGKKIPYASSYEIEWDVCINCGFCAAACNFGALVLDHNLETARHNREALHPTKERLLRPASYFEKIAPTVWAEIREDAAKRLAGTMKRRPDGVGIVPKER
jgi:formate hydrogenlyase subunit 6/NADH:ubiquinone oxidoreductase subunit I